MEHLHQVEEVIFTANYESFKRYYTSSHHSPPLQRTYQLNSYEVASGMNTVSMALGNSSVEDSENPPDFYMSWNPLHYGTSGMIWIASQQPHCVWPLFHMGFCLMVLLIHSVIKAVFGNLRSVEKENMKEQLWNLVFYKVVFVFGVATVENVQDLVGWFSFVSLIGLLQLGRQLCHERHNYLILMNDWSRRGRFRRHRILALLSFNFLASVGMFLSVGGWCLFFRNQEQRAVNNVKLKEDIFPGDTPQLFAEVHRIPDFNFSLHSAIFMMCELGLLVIQTIHVLIICILEQIHSRWPKAKYMNEDAYSNICNALNFRFDMISLLFDLLHHIHMLVCCNLFLSMTSLVVALQMRQRVRDIHEVLKKRQSYLWLNEHLLTYPDVPYAADSKECSLTDDKCAICWDLLSSQKSKVLPCHHIFHRPCLRQWLIVSMNCPTCRRSLINEKEIQFQSLQRTSRRLYTPRPPGIWGFLQTGQALLDLFGGWDPQYDDSYDEDPSETPLPPSIPTDQN